MRRLFLSLAAAGTLICQQAAAQLQCMSPADRAAFDVQALRSEMMVLATGCSDDAQYNAFITRYQSGTCRRTSGTSTPGSSGNSAGARRPSTTAS